MARNVMAALARPDWSIDLVSEFRSFDKHGDPALQARLIDQGARIAEELVDQGGWDAWVTYHSYYKAPDLLGPVVARALGIPYVVAEATRASKRRGGPWDVFEQKAEQVCDATEVLFYLTSRDSVSLGDHLKGGQQLVHLAPFLGLEALPEAATPRKPVILIVAMMRAGDKLRSYKIAAEAMRHLEGDWAVEIAGDGPVRADVEALFGPFGPRVQFLGALDAAEMGAAYRRASVLLWPGVNEAFGMVYLEAQAHGVPVVAENRPGVCDVVAEAGLLAQGAPIGLAQELHRLLNNGAYHSKRADAARERVEKYHLLGAARSTLWHALTPLVRGDT